MTASSEQLQSRLADITQRIEHACETGDRDPHTVRLIAVSKRQPASAIESAFALGIRDFGENYVQELSTKSQSLSHLPGLRLHMIGRLQSNKAKDVAPLASAVHTLDSEKLGNELNRRAELTGRILPVFLGVNIGKEAQKSGLSPDGVVSLINKSAAWPNLAVEGLMCIPPHVAHPEKARPYFRALRKLRDTLDPKLPRLSMGMSQDFHIAVEEGATDIRVGTALFGERPRVQ